MADETNEPEGEAPEAATETGADAKRVATPRRRVRKATPEKNEEAKPKTRAKKAPATTRERKSIVRVPKPERERGKLKERRGVVVSNAMDKTVVVRVDTVRPHPAYKKVVRRSTKFHAHDEGNIGNVGDYVRIVETRPLSKTKTWRLAEVLEAAK